MSDEIKERFKKMNDKVVKSESKKLSPVSDADLKAMANKSEDDSNSYSKINKSIISKMKSEAKSMPPASDKDIKILKGKKDDEK